MQVGTLVVWGRCKASFAVALKTAYWLQANACTTVMLDICGKSCTATGYHTTQIQCIHAGKANIRPQSLQVKATRYVHSQSEVQIRQQESAQICNKLVSVLGGLGVGHQRQH